MPEIKIQKEEPVGLADVKDYLDNKKKNKKDLNFREKKSLEYINAFVKLKKDKADELKKELTGLGMVRLKEKHIIKIVDLVPKDVEELKMILSGEDITLKTEDLNKVIDIIRKYI